MFNTLLESRPARQRSFGGQLASVAVHGAIIGGAVLGTRQAVVAAPPVVHETITFVAPPVVVPAEPPAAAAPPDVAAPPTSAPVPIVVPTIVAPIEVPSVIPRIDLTREVTSAADYATARVTASREPGTGAAVCPTLPVPCTPTSDVYAENAVDKPAKALTGYGVPEYPDLLKQAGVEGRVRVSFVIDIDGRADVRTLTVLEASRPEFAESIRKALPTMRFLPAELRGRKVKQLVVLPFTFEIK